MFVVPPSRSHKQGFPQGLGSICCPAWPLPLPRCFPFPPAQPCSLRSGTLPHRVWAPFRERLYFNKIYDYSFYSSKL